MPTTVISTAARALMSITVTSPARGQYLRHVRALLVHASPHRYLARRGLCGVQPWVKPYERANLADPIMSLDRDPVSTSYRSHVFQARGAARGAEAGHGGGCGCN